MIQLSAFQKKLKACGVNPYHSACFQEQEFRRVLEKAKPKIAIEIGTYQGASTALIAEYADIVYTIDVLKDWEDTQTKVWKACGVSDKIYRFTVHSTPLKKAIADAIRFDFAFVDGSHMMEGLKADFDLVKRCNNVLFHDYWLNNGSWDDVVDFVDTLKPKALIDMPFALWGKNA